MSIRRLQGAPCLVGTGQGHSLPARLCDSTNLGKVSAGDGGSGHEKGKIHQYVPKGYFGGR